MAALARPTIVIIPGAFHIPSHFSSLCAQLEKAGYATASIQLPSVDPSTPAAAAVGTPYNDALFIREKLLLPLIEGEGKDVVLLMHSYGGSPGNGSAVGLSKKGRERDEKKGGVVGLVFVSAYVAKEGQNIREDFSTPGDAKRFEKSSTALAIDVSLSFFWGMEGEFGPELRNVTETYKYVHFARMDLVFKILYDPICSHLNPRMDAILFTLPLYPNPNAYQKLSPFKRQKRAQ